MDIDKNIVGRVIAANIGEGIIYILLHKDPSSIKIGMPLIVHSHPYKYFCMIVNIVQTKDTTTLKISKRRDIDNESGVPFDKTGNPNISPYDIVIHAKCSKRYDGTNENIAKEPFISIPEIHSFAKEATKEEIHTIYASDKWKDYWFGNLQSSNYRVPIAMEKLVERPCAILGNTGSGKSVTVRDLLKAGIYDPQSLLDTSFIVFDTQDEYSWSTPDGNNGLLKFKELVDKIKVFTLDIKSWDIKVPANISHKSGFAKMVRIFKDNVTADDIVAILPQESLTDKMRYTVHAMDDIARKEHVPFYCILERYYNEGFDASDSSNLGKMLSTSPDSYAALRWRLRPILEGALGTFICDRVEGEKDTYEIIKDYLDRTANKEQTYSFIFNFGQYGNKPFIYEFIANLITRKLYDLYTGIENAYIDKNNRIKRFRKLVLVIEEAHKFIPKKGGIDVFRLIAREARKFDLTLWIIDQKPSSIEEETASQISNLIIHQLRSDEDIRVALSGYGTQWKSIVATLERGHCLVIGEIVEYMPTVIHSYYAYGDLQKERVERGWNTKETMTEIIDKSFKSSEEEIEEDILAISPIPIPVRVPKKKKSAKKAGETKEKAHIIENRQKRSIAKITDIIEKKKKTTLDIDPIDPEIDEDFL